MIELLVASTLILILATLVILFALFGKFREISLDQKAVKGAIATCGKELGIDQDMRGRS